MSPPARAMRVVSSIACREPEDALTGDDATFLFGSRLTQLRRAVGHLRVCEAVSPSSEGGSFGGRSQCCCRAHSACRSSCHAQPSARKRERGRLLGQGSEQARGRLAVQRSRW